MRRLHWLDEKLKPLSVNDHTISDVFNFVDALHDMEVDDHSINKQSDSIRAKLFI